MAFCNLLPTHNLHFYADYVLIVLVHHMLQAFCGELLVDCLQVRALDFLLDFDYHLLVVLVVHQELLVVLSKFLEILGEFLQSLLF